MNKENRFLKNLNLKWQIAIQIVWLALVKVNSVALFALEINISLKGTVKNLAHSLNILIPIESVKTVILDVTPVQDLLNVPHVLLGS